MASTRPKSSVNQNRRTSHLSDHDRIRAFGASMNSSFANSDYQAIPLSTSYLHSGIQNLSHSQSVPPPLPPRTDASRYGRLSNYNSYYAPYSRYSPGPSMYSAYGGYRAPYSRYGMPPESYNSFIQLAEESTRPAFESIESVVDVVGSISMMLESTYHAVHSSYNAILGVVDQFSRLKDHLAEVVSCLALLRALRYLCLKVLYLLRLRKNNPAVEAAWNKAKSVSEQPDISRFHEDGKSPWPFMLFIGLVIGAPWLMFKLLAKSVSTKKPFDVSSWKGKNGYAICVANYDFTSTRRGELSFSSGEHLFIAPKHLQANAPRGWMVASNKKNQIGLIPQNYLKMQVNPVQRLARPSGNTSHTEEMEATYSSSSDMQKDAFASEEEPSTNGTVPNPSCIEESTTENKK